MISVEKFEEAIAFAIKAHKGQVRKGDKRPYILHPFSVINRVYANKKSKNMYLLGAAAALHDTVEDCGVTLDTIAKLFGTDVAAIVGELTSDHSQYEDMSKAEYLTIKMRGMSSYALTIKLCDRLDNVSDLNKMNKQFRMKYMDETHDILSGLKGRKLTDTHINLIGQIYDVIWAISREEKIIKPLKKASK